jgi:CMP-2-keto-3-deoxyoctulosonic acid synthetase
VLDKNNYALYFSHEPTPLKIEKSIDMNRVLESGEKVRTVYCEQNTFAADIPSDIKK